jgi:hypothetical protein
MKLSEAILLGSTMLAAKPGGQYFSETKSGCALGMAAVARGCSFQRATRPINENERRALGAKGSGASGFYAWSCDPVSAGCSARRARCASRTSSPTFSISTS